jgi:hypothetical protein
MLHRILPADPTLADRFGWLLYGLFDGMAQDWRRRGLRHIHQAEINQRILGLWKRLRSVLERYRAGTLTAVRARKIAPHPGFGPLHDPNPQGEREKGRAPRAVPGWSVLPRKFGWLKSLLAESQACVSCFNWLLVDNAEMQAVIAAAPVQIGRVLRPFCHFLGLEVPAELRLAKRRRVRKRGTSLRPSPHSGEGALSDERGEMIVPNRRLPPREQAEDAMRRSEASGKPIDLKKFKAEAYGWWAHPPRDANCPPPKIGYGGRLRPLPKDYKPPRDWE